MEETPLYQKIFSGYLQATLPTEILHKYAKQASQPAIFQERSAGLKPRVREKSLIIGADIMGRDMDQNHGKHAKGHLLHLIIFIKAPQPRY